MSLIALVLLLAALALVTAAEWPRLQKLLGLEAREGRKRQKRKAHLRLVSRRRPPRPDRHVAKPEPTDDFAASVKRDLENLPVIEPRDDGS